ncbi:MAG TPA: serine hydrolase domain-containing protein [Candidatus Binataceae bacterium]|nr:serine hydrolase domain-containing protein [Candidatus Binataceae bacterium]
MVKRNYARSARLVHFSRCSVVIALSLLLLACSHKPPPAAPEPRNIEQLKAAIADVLARHRVPGCGFAIVSRDKIDFAGGVGKADIAANRDVDANTLFRIGSITKGFIALSLLQLHERGKLDLDAKLSDLAPEVPIVNPWEGTNPVTLAEVLEHTAGFNDFPVVELYDFDSPPGKPLLWTLQHFPQSLRVRWRPGSRMSYSNPGYGVAGYVLEKVGGAPCEQYVAQNILQPLGMNSSTMTLTPEASRALAQGYEGTAEKIVPYHDIYLRSAGSMMSSPADMSRFVRMMINRGELDGVRVVSPDSITRMETPETSLAVRVGLKYGYGLGNAADLAHPFIMHGHDGGIDGFLSEYQYDSDAGVGYFFSINSGDAAAVEGIRKLLYNYVVRDLPKPAAAQTVAADGSDEQLAGFYRFASPRQEKFKYQQLLLADLIVSARGGALYARPILAFPGRKLIADGNGLFRTEGDPAPTIAFTKDSDGNDVMIDLYRPIGGYFVRRNPVWPYIRLALAILCLLAILSSPLFALIWIPRKLLGRLKGVRIAARVMPLLALVSLGFALAGIFAPAAQLGKFGVPALELFLGSIGFAVFSLAALVLSVRQLGYPANRAARVHTLTVSVACCLVTWYLAYWGMIGFRLWLPY